MNKCISLCGLPSWRDHWCPGGFKNKPLGPPPPGLCSGWRCTSKRSELFSGRPNSYFRLLKEELVGLSPLSLPWEGEEVNLNIRRLKAGTQPVLKSSPLPVHTSQLPRELFTGWSLLSPKIPINFPLAWAQTLTEFKKESPCRRT